MTLKSSYGISKMTIISLNDQNEHVTTICAHIWLDDHYYDILTAICRHSLMENLAWVVLIVFQFWVLTYSLTYKGTNNNWLSHRVYIQTINWFPGKAFLSNFGHQQFQQGQSLWSLYNAWLCKSASVHYLVFKSHGWCSELLDLDLLVPNHLSLSTL